MMTQSPPRGSFRSPDILTVVVCFLSQVPDPYLNEPGYERQGRACSQALQYNNEQRLNTLQYALPPALQNPPRLFEDVTKTHCRAKRADIQEQCKSWQKMVNKHHKPQMVAIVGEINAELDKLR